MYRTVEVRGKVSSFLLFFLFSLLSPVCQCYAWGQRAVLAWEKIGATSAMEVWGSLVKIDRRGGVDVFNSGVAPYSSPGLTGGSAAAQLALRYRPDGSPDWASLYIPIESSQSVVTVDSVVLDAQDNAFVAGTLYSPRENGAPNFDILVRKQNRNGRQLWADQYDSDDSGESLDTVAGITLDGFGGVFVAGNSQVVVDGQIRQALTLLRYDGGGNRLWVVHHSQPQAYEEAVCALPDGKGGAYLVGRVFPDSSRGAVIARYDPQGNLLWETLPAAAASTTTPLFPLAATGAVDGSGGIYVCVNSLDRPDSFTCLKYSVLGDLLWRIEERTAGAVQKAVQMLVDSRGEVVVASSLEGVRSGYAVTRFTLDGTKKSSSVYRGRLNEALYASDLGVDSFGNAFITGLSLSQTGEPSKHATVKFDTTGRFSWRFDFGGPRRTMLDLPRMAVDPQSNVAVTGMTASMTVDSLGNVAQSVGPAVYLLR